MNSSTKNVRVLFALLLVATTCVALCSHALRISVSETEKMRVDQKGDKNFPSRFTIGKPAAEPRGTKKGAEPRYPDAPQGAPLTAAEKAEAKAEASYRKKHPVVDVVSEKQKPLQHARFAQQHGPLTPLVARPRFTQAFPDSPLELTMLNIGNADAILIQYGEFSMLIDAGRSAVAQLVADMGVSKLDVFLLTHPHADHTRGTRRVLENLEPSHFILGTTSAARRRKYDGYVGAAGDAEVHRLQHTRTGILTVGHVTVRMHSAPDGVRHQDTNENMHSVAVEIIYHNRLVRRTRYMVLTGDAEVELQNAWMGYQWANDFRHIHFFKVSHHGSDNGVSPQFWDGRSCWAAGISTSGTHGTYGHPHDAATDFFLRKCTFVRRTDENHHTHFRNAKRQPLDKGGHVYFEVDEDVEVRVGRVVAVAVTAPNTDGDDPDATAD